MKLLGKFQLNYITCSCMDAICPKMQLYPETKFVVKTQLIKTETENKTWTSKTKTIKTKMQIVPFPTLAFKSPITGTPRSGNDGNDLRFKGPKPGNWCKLHEWGQSPRVRRLFTLWLNCYSAAIAI